jgi:peptide/nickel transport system substrate-binding protein
VAGLAQLRASSAGKLYSGPAPLEVTLVVASPKGAEQSQHAQGIADGHRLEGHREQVFAGEASPIPLQTAPAAYGFAKDELTRYAESVKTDGTPRMTRQRSSLPALPRV